ncbi:MAG: MFS transporter [Bacteriovoracia bacterium]
MSAKITLKSPRFYAFLLAQFLGAANDNAFKTTIVLLVLATVAEPAEQVRFSSLATAVMPAAFLLFSPLAGYVADRYRKLHVLFWTKLPEVLAMLLATWVLGAGSLPLLIAVFFFLCVHSAFFSPAKYGLFPEVFAERDLSLANGILQMTTNVAILVGSIGGVLVYSKFKTEPQYIGWTLTAVAALGTVAVLFVPRSEQFNPQARFVWNILSSAWDDLQEVRKTNVLLQTLLGIGYFYFLGAIFLNVIPIFGKNVLGLAEESAGLLLAVLSVGIAGGSILAGKLSRGRVELGLVPLGSIVLSLVSMDLALFGNGGIRLFLGLPLRTILDLGVLGIGAGFFIVPLQALLQQRSPAGMKGRFIAFSNVLSFVGVLIAAGLSWFLTDFLHLQIQQVVITVSLLTFAATIYILSLLPEAFVRLVLWILSNTIYRVRVRGAENIPASGALLVANHVSWVDALLIGASCDRPVRFMMYRPFYETPGLHWFFRKMGVIPVSSKDPREKKQESLAMARDKILDGDLVCIFAEGAITRTGNLLRFRRGLEAIATEANKPIVPVVLSGLWGSIFSFEGGKLLFKWPKRIPYPVDVIYGKPLVPTAKAHEVRHAMQELLAESFVEQVASQAPIPLQFLETARRNSARLFVADSQQELTFRQAANRAFWLSRYFLPEHDVHAGPPIGIALEPGVDNVVANLSVMLAGRVPVNFDYFESGEFVEAEAKAAEIRTWLTSSAMLQKYPGLAKIPGEKRVLIDEVTPKLAPAYSFSAMLRQVRDRVSPDLRAPAAILFKFDGARRPKGIVLSHLNLLSNLSGLRQVFQIDGEDRVFSTIPSSYSMSFTGGILLPAIYGCASIFHPNSENTAILADLARRFRPTIMAWMGPSFEKYGLALDPEAFGTVGKWVVGGGRLSPDFLTRFQARFGKSPLEGFGCAECSPIISLNIPDYKSERTHQAGSRPGTLGHPLPGVCVKIVGGTDGRALPPNEEGFLWVKGPNVMKEYLNDPRGTSAAIGTGWFNTGAKGYVDEDGFLTLTS